MKYIVAVDQSTSSSKAFLVDERGMIARKTSRAHKQYYPAPGRVEHDAQEIYENVVAIIDEITDGISPKDLSALAITNQRETTVLWDRKSGVPVRPAIVWQDIRGEEICRELQSENARVRGLTGSDLSPYLPASKLSALLREDSQLRARAGEIFAGTIESYLIFRLTGGRFVSDYSNASRTQLMNLRTLTWEPRLVDMFGLRRDMLPAELLPCDAVFGHYKGMPIVGVLGDSFATLFGQGCHRPGETKISYGTGTSVMMNVGGEPVIPDAGLTTAVAFSFQGALHYAMEGNITCSGDTLVWLRDDLRLFESLDELEALAKSVPDAQGVRLVPALSGLGAPFFDSRARAVLCGMSRGTKRAHVARAALESMAQQAADVFEVLAAQSGHTVSRLMADGGGSGNELLMQLQADLVGCELYRPMAGEFSALGAAYMAGLATGVYADFDRIPARDTPGRRYLPRMSAEAREELRRRWAVAVQAARLG